MGGFIQDEWEEPWLGNDGPRVLRIREQGETEEPEKENQACSEKQGETGRGKAWWLSSRVFSQDVWIKGGHVSGCMHELWEGVWEKGSAKVEPTSVVIN